MATSHQLHFATLKRSRRVRAAVAGLGALLGGAAASEARVTSNTISTRTLAFDGRTFGDVRAYEQLRGTVSGELDPHDRRNAVITDIDLAPRNARGRVEYTATFTLLKPLDMSMASGVLVYEVNNRGNKILLLPPGVLNIGVSDTNLRGTAFSSTREMSTCGTAGRAISYSIRICRRKPSPCPLSAV